MRAGSLFITFSLCILFASVSEAKLFRKSRGANGAIQKLSQLSSETSYCQYPYDNPITISSNNYNYEDLGGITIFRCETWGDCPPACGSNYWRKCPDNAVNQLQWGNAWISKSTPGSFCVCSQSQLGIQFAEPIWSYPKVKNGSTIQAFGKTC